jgi:hypothetical protein
MELTATVIADMTGILLRSMCTIYLKIREGLAELLTGFAPRDKHLSLRPVKPEDWVLQILALVMRM